MTELLNDEFLYIQSLPKKVVYPRIYLLKLAIVVKHKQKTYSWMLKNVQFQGMKGVDCTQSELMSPSRHLYSYCRCSESRNGDILIVKL